MSFESCFGGFAGSKSAPAAMGRTERFDGDPANGRCRRLSGCQDRSNRLTLTGESGRSSPALALSYGGALEHAQEMAVHESPRTTKLYDRTKERLTQDEVERIRL